MNPRNTALALLSLAIAVICGCNQQANNGEKGTPEKIPFKGKIALDVRESTPDWSPFLPKTAPAGSPNILFILYDDSGLAGWSSYGGRISMPP